MKKKVITVLGKVDPGEMGITDAHSHIWISSQDVPAVNPPVLDQISKIQAELLAYRQEGGGAQIDFQPGGAGRNASRLRELSLSSGVAIVACTGFHLPHYYPAGSKIWGMDSEQAANYFREEILLGLEETRSKSTVYPGFIKVAVLSDLEKSPKHLLEAAVEVSKDTGLLIQMHTEKGAGVGEISKFLTGMGLDQNRLVLCHIDKRPDIGLHQELAQEGYLLEYDTFFRPKYKPEKYLWPLISKMVESGYSRSIALATDQADPDMWKSLGSGVGLPGFVSVIKKRLDKVFPDKKIVLDLMGGNISRWLAVN